MPPDQMQSAAWQQFIDGKQAMLADYDRARSHALTQPVSTLHGNVAEAAVRHWLSTFLPKRFGVTAGYIRSQGFDALPQSRHFDVIIYDQLEAPTLWIEDNKDKSEQGGSRIVPAENVSAILEVKATLNRRTMADAADKFAELAPLMVATDAPDERYPKYLPESALLAILCFELRKEDSHDVRTLEVVRDINLSRGFYGAIVLRGESRRSTDTALIRQTVGEQAQNEWSVEEGLLSAAVMPATVEMEAQHRGAFMMWGDVNFSRFAFDLLAILKGTYRQGLMSSFHGLDFTAWKSKE